VVPVLRRRQHWRRRTRRTPHSFQNFHQVRHRSRREPRSVRRRPFLVIQDRKAAVGNDRAIRHGLLQSVHIRVVLFLEIRPHRSRHCPFRHVCVHRGLLGGRTLRRRWTRRHPHRCSTHSLTCQQTNHSYAHSYPPKIFATPGNISGRTAVWIARRETALGDA